MPIEHKRIEIVKNIKLCLTYKRVKSQTKSFVKVLLMKSINCTILTKKYTRELAVIIVILVSNSYRHIFPSVTIYLKHLIWEIVFTLIQPSSKYYEQ